MKARTEEMLAPQGPRRPRAEARATAASATSSSRCSCSNSCTAGTTDRSARAPTLDALEQLATGGYVDASTTPRSSTRRTCGCAPSSTGCSSSTSTRPTRCRPTTARARISRACSASATRPSASGARAFDVDAPAPPGGRAVDPREAVLRAAARHARRRRRRCSIAAAEERLTAFGFHDIEQTRAALRELTAGPHAPVARHAAAAARDARLAVGRARPRPRPARSCGGSPRATRARRRSRAASARRRSRPSARAASSARRACSALALHRQPEFVDALADDDDSRDRGPTRASLIDDALDTLDWREDDAGPPRRAAPLQAPRAAAHRRRATSLGFADLDDRRARAVAPRRRDASKPRCSRSSRTVPFAVIGLGRLGGARAVVRVRHRRDVRLRRRRPRRLRPRRAHRDAARARDRRQHVGGPDVPRRRPAAAGRQPGPARPFARRATDTYCEQLGADVGVPGAHQGALSSPATPSSARAFLDCAAAFVYRDPFPEDWRREIRRMKARIERERIPPGEDPQFHLKLGRGSLSDVEFTVQLEQLEHGASTPEESATRRRCGALAALVGDRRRLATEDATRALRGRTSCANERGTTATCSPVRPATRCRSTATRPRRSRACSATTHRPQQTLREEYRRVTRAGAGSRRTRLLRPRRECSVVTWDGDEYQARFDALAARRASTSTARRPSSRRDPGPRRCSTPAAVRAASRSSSPGAGWRSSASTSTRRCWRRRGATSARRVVLADLATLDLGRAVRRRRDGRQRPALHADGNASRRRRGMRGHVGGESLLVAGFQLGRGYALADYDAALSRRRPRARRALRHLGPGAVHERRLRRVGASPNVTCDTADAHVHE